MKRLNVVVVALISVALAGCQQQPGPNGGVSKQTMGTVGGAVIGGVLGSKIGKGTGQGIAIGAGTLLGALAGSEIGASLDRADMMHQQQTATKALEYSQPGETLPWRNTRSGNSGTITPHNYYQTSDGTYCREYTQTINVGGHSQQGVGQACRQPDGSWQIVQ